MTLQETRHRHDHNQSKKSKVDSEYKGTSTYNWSWTENMSQLFIAHEGSEWLSGRTRKEKPALLLGISNREWEADDFLSSLMRVSNLVKNSSTLSLLKANLCFFRIRTLEPPSSLALSSPLSSLDIRMLSITFLHLALEDSGILHLSRAAALSFRFYMGYLNCMWIVETIL